MLGPIREYDKKNNSEFLETLRIFLEENEDIVATCKRLFIHRNTLAYRLKRIEEITNRSMAEAEARLDFRIAFKICLYLIMFMPNFFKTVQYNLLYIGMCCVSPTHIVLPLY